MVGDSDLLRTGRSLLHYTAKSEHMIGLAVSEVRVASLGLSPGNHMSEIAKALVLGPDVVYVLPD